MSVRTLLLVILGSLPTTVVDAQNAPALAGRWEGTLVPRVQSGSRGLSQRANRPRLPTVVIIAATADRTYSGTWASTSQNGITAIGEITIDGDTIRIPVPLWRGVFEGKLSADGSKLEGEWEQNGLISPFTLTKVAQH